MRKNDRKETRGRGRRGGKILSVVGTALIVGVILLCSLLIVPKAFGCQMYHVLSGSMEPELAVGSLIYVREEKPEEIEADDIIAFYGSLEDSGIITHRVIKNNVVSGTFRTKGDANEQEDPLAVPYENFIGRVIFSVPYMGRILTWTTSFYGKLAAVGVVLLGVVLNLTASFQRRDNGEMG